MTLKNIDCSDDVPAEARAHAGCVTSGGRDDGGTAVEYALMIALIATVIFASVALFGLAVADLFLVPCEALGGCGT